VSTSRHAPGSFTAQKSARTSAADALRILDRELPHVGQATVRSVHLFRQPIVLSDDVALLVKRGRVGERPAGSQRADLCEDPRVSDCTAGDRHSVDARVMDHVEAGLGVEQIAAAQHDAITGMFF
jgi:hypothetical protein